MKRVKLISLGLALTAVAMFTGCSPSVADILKKYENYAVMDAADNKARISVSKSKYERTSVQIDYANQQLNTTAKYITALSERIIVANAENPAEIFQVSPQIMRINGTSTVYEGTQAKTVNLDYYTTIVPLNDVKAKFILIGFQGIDGSESATPPCFFIVSKDKELTVLTQQPQLADGLFAVDYPKTHFEPQTYSGTIKFEKSKDVTMQFTLTADGTQFTEMKLSAKELYLSPENRKASSNNDKSEESKFKFSDDARANSSFAITNVGGINVMARDANGNYVIDKVIFSGGIENTIPVEVSKGKVSSDDVFHFDLSVTDVCIYGTIQIQIQGSATKPVYAVFKNVTTPQKIPSEILNPK